MTDDPLSTSAGELVEEYNDLTPMPFGMHQGVPLQDVPASYFHFLWVTLGHSKSHTPLHRYIKRNLNALKKEFPDGIWN